MKITYACLHNYKRLQGSRIREFEGEFKNPVQIIVGSNSSGKTSLMRELSPLPSIRTDYEKDGYKELHIAHEGHSYILKSDFSNRTSPHSFTVDDVELNVGHTSQMQEELAVKHFGFTTAVRNLVYGKTRLCSMTPVNRKNMFLELNPMDLSLVVSAFKTSYAIFKDSKANVALLNQRKASLEASMISASVLAEHIKTKTELEKKLLELEKLQYGVDNQLASIKSAYAEDLSYYNQCTSQGKGVLDENAIVAECRAMTRRTMGYKDIDRTTYIEDKLHLKSECDNLTSSKSNLEQEIVALNQEIDEFHRHLQQLHTVTPDKLEREIAGLDEQIAKYTNLPSSPIPQDVLTHADNILAKLDEQLTYWGNLNVVMEDPDTVRTRIRELDSVILNLNSVTSRCADIAAHIQDLERDITTATTQASVPSSCTNTSCGLRKLHTQRTAHMQVKVQELLTTKIALDAEIATLTQQRDELISKYATHKQYDTPTKLGVIHRTITSIYPIEEDELITKLNINISNLYKSVVDRVNASRSYYACQEYVVLRAKKVAELEATLKSSAAVSAEFLTTQLEHKRQQVTAKRDMYTGVLSQLATTTDMYQLYARYQSDRERITQLVDSYSRAERALTAVAAVKYWSDIRTNLEQQRTEIHTRLGELSTLVRDQEVIRKTYESETIALLDEVTARMDIHEAIASALSPNSGITHKSMVRYLNAMIGHVNYFISQLWSFRLQLATLSEGDSLTYQFPIEIADERASDINHLSDGQTEVVDFTWSLAILLQLRMLDRIPLYADELGRACDLTHRNKILMFLNSLVDNNLVEQIFLINHYAAMQEGFTNSDIICLNPDNLGELPPNVNEHIHLVKF